MLSLGTAQFGMDYGISNSDGKVSRTDVAEILELCSRRGISSLDTAAGYGESETILGSFDLSNFSITTKLKHIGNISPAEIRTVIKQAVSASLCKMQKKSLSALLIHDVKDLMRPGASILWETLLELKEANVVSAIGYSIYDPMDLDIVFSKFKPDVVQCPFNVFDQRIKTSGWLSTLNEENVSVQARSIFLQGALLMDRKTRPIFFERWSLNFDGFESCCSLNGLTKLQACVLAAVSEKFSHIVVGVTRASELNEILDASELKRDLSVNGLAMHDKKLIEPFRWKT